MYKKLEISLTTIQNRRKRLEKEFLENDYTLLLEKFGWRRVDFFISTTDGKTDALANDLLSMRHTRTGSLKGSTSNPLSSKTVRIAYITSGSLSTSNTFISCVVLSLLILLNR